MVENGEAFAQPSSPAFLSATASPGQQSPPPLMWQHMQRFGYAACFALPAFPATWQHQVQSMAHTIESAQSYLPSAHAVSPPPFFDIASLPGSFFHAGSRVVAARQVQDALPWLTDFCLDTALLHACRSFGTTLALPAAPSPPLSALTFLVLFPVERRERFSAQAWLSEMLSTLAPNPHGVLFLSTHPADLPGGELILDTADTPLIRISAQAGRLVWFDSSRSTWSISYPLDRPDTTDYVYYDPLGPRPLVLVCLSYSQSLHEIEP